MRYALLLAALPLVAQTSPYTSMQQRSVKALSDDAIRDYREGAGMGLALAAELNGYPGPKHVLELADKLQLTDAQKAAVKKSFDAMHADAVKLGNDILILEKALDIAFREAKVDREQLAAMTSKIAALQGRLRYRHLAAHLEAREILTDAQRRVYAKLRGYTTQKPEEHKHEHQHHH